MAKKKEDLIREILNDPDISKDLAVQLKLDAKAEYEKLQKQHTREIVYEILKIFGVVTLTLFILIALETLFELSLFGAMFNHSSYKFYWGLLMGVNRVGGYNIGGVQYSADAVQQMFANVGAGDFSQWIIDIGAKPISPAFDDWMYFQDPWLPATIITILMVALVVGLALVYSIVITDMISFVKRFGKFGKSIVTEVTGNVAEAIEENREPDKTNKKLFEDEQSTPVLPVDENAKPEVITKKKRGRKPKIEAQEEKKVNTYEDLSDDQIDQLLSYPHTAEEEQLLQNIEEAKDTDAAPAPATEKPVNEPAAPIVENKAPESVNSLFSNGPRVDSEE